MQIKFLTPIAGERFAYATGDVVDLPDEMAKKLVAAGHAEPAGAAGAKARDALKRAMGGAETAAQPGAKEKAARRQSESGPPARDALKRAMGGAETAAQPGAKEKAARRHAARA